MNVPGVGLAEHQERHVRNTVRGSKVVQQPAQQRLAGRHIRTPGRSHISGDTQ
jgi:hypothetical protein